MLSALAAGGAAQQLTALGASAPVALGSSAAAGAERAGLGGRDGQESTAPASETAAGQRVGGIFQCDRFSGADAAIKANACNAAAIAAGGGIIDLRNLLEGNTTGSEEIEINTRAGDKALIGVTALFPTKGTYTTTMVGGPAAKATVYPGGGGSGYTSGCTVIPVEEGFAYTARAKGAVFSVTASNGVVKGLTRVSGGSGYLTSKYVKATNGTCTGSGLIMNLQAADCGIRLNGRGTIQTGSVGAGAASFDIQPSSANSGFVVEALFCTDEESGYVRQEGGLKTDNFTPAARTVAGTALIRNVVDHAVFNLLETSGPHDDGVRIDNACCGANFYSLHANTGNTGGYPIIVGSGGVIQNACTTAGSNVITAPYAHFTAEYLGDTIRAGKAGSSTNFPPGALTITGINSLNSITVSAQATVTNSTNPACTSPALEGGTGLTLHISDPTAPTTTQISLYHPVANGPGPGLQNILITGAVSGLSTYGAYLESNSSVDKSTAQTYIGYPAGQVNFYNFYAPGPASGGAKYAIQSDTPFGWCMFGGISSSGLLDEDVLIPPAANKNLTYCKGGMPYAINSTNLLPDTDLKQGSVWWTIPPGVSIAGGVGPSGDNAFTYTLSGTSSGLLFIPVKLPIPNLQPNRTYTAGAHIDFSGGAAGSVNVKLCSAANCTGPTYMNAYVNSEAGRAGIVAGRFSAPSFTGPYFVIALQNVKGSGTVTVSEPFLVAGNLASYTENDGGFGSEPGQGLGAVTAPAMERTGASAMPAAGRVLTGACVGTASSSASNLAIYPFGTGSSSCASTLNPLYGALMPSAGTVSGLAVRCGTSGSQPASGVFTIYDYPNGGGGSRPTGVSVTYGTTPAKTSVRDTMHSYAYSAGDLLVVQYSTQANETLANCTASFIY